MERDGYYIESKGYMRHYDKEMVHRRVWRKNNGPVPNGFFIHHIDGNKQNNDISNLTLMDALTHKREHTFCRKINGVWFKKCVVCGVESELNRENWYMLKNADVPMYGKCKICHRKITVMSKSRKRKGLPYGVALCKKLYIESISKTGE